MTVAGVSRSLSLRTSAWQIRRSFYKARARVWPWAARSAQERGDAIPQSEMTQASGGGAGSARTRNGGGGEESPKLLTARIDFAQVLLDWRTRHAWTRKEAAMKLAVSWRTLQDWEQGRRIPSQMAQSGVFAQMSKIDDQTET